MGFVATAVMPAHLRKLFEIYYFDDRPMGGMLEQQFCDLIREKAPDFDVVVVADFGHGLITRKSIDALTETAYLLRNQSQKRVVWEDLQKVHQALGLPPLPSAPQEGP